MEEFKFRMLASLGVMEPVPENKGLVILTQTDRKESDIYVNDEASFGGVFIHNHSYLS